MALVTVDVPNAEHVQRASHFKNQMGPEVGFDHFESNINF